MKTLLLSALFMLLIVAGWNSYAQIPEFTLIEEGELSDDHGSHTMGAALDMDGDGDLDLVIGRFGAAGSDRPFQLLMNERDGIYRDRGTLVPVSTQYNNNFIGPLADVDNDGDIDHVARTPTNPGVFLNDGRGNFALDTTIISNGYPMGYPVLVDINVDGNLDLVMLEGLGMVIYGNGEGGFIGEPDTLYPQLETGSWGTHSMGWCDADDDGDMDVYMGFSGKIGQYATHNAFMINTGDGFEDLGPAHITLQDTATTPSTNWVDYDNDGDMDLFLNEVGLLDSQGGFPALYENLGNLDFVRHNIIDEKYRGILSSCSAWEDLDNDGDQDLLLSAENNTNPWTGELPAWTTILLYQNNGDGSFTDITDHTLVSESSHSLYIFDSDNDGDQDVVLIHAGWSEAYKNRLFLNDGNDNSWISINCQGTLSNRSAIGARIYARAYIGGEHTLQTREIAATYGHLSYDKSRKHFGLGDAEMVDTLMIRWPSGHVDTYLDVQANRFYRAIEDSVLEIDLRATNYIEYKPFIPDTTMYMEETISFDLTEYYAFIAGDTVPGDVEDLVFSINDISRVNVIEATLVGSVLTVHSLDSANAVRIKIGVDNGFSSRIDNFIVIVVEGEPVEKVTGNESFSIYPNPAGDELNLEIDQAMASNAEVEILDLTGKLITRKVLTPGSLTTTIDLSGLAKGVYLLKASSDNRISVEKFIKN